MKQRFTAALAVLVGISSCDFWSFGAYRDNATVLTFPVPVDYPELNFGTVLAAGDDGAGRAWALASGGLGTPALAIPLFANDVFRPPLPVASLCGTGHSCGDARGGLSLAILPTWAGQRGCIVTSSFGMTSNLRGRCLVGTTPTTFTIDPPSGIEASGFGFSLAIPRRSLDGRAPPGDLLFIGSPGGLGRLFAARPGNVQDITPPNIPREGGFSSSIAVGRAPGTAAGATEWMVYASAPQTSRVYAMSGTAEGQLRIRGCAIRGAEAGFGGVIAAGDFDGDGAEDLAVGARPEVNPRTARVHVFLASRVPNDNVCTEEHWAEAGSLACSDDLESGVRCGTENGIFGAALAAADLDRDGTDELLVGAPGVTVENTENAGAVFVYRFRNGMFQRASVLHASTPIERTALGTGLASVRLGNREEFIASGPNRGLWLYLCSGIDGDRPDAGSSGMRCR